ncbi:MAG: ECF transporter S component [Rikenellaceae bacterium]
MERSVKLYSLGYSEVSTYLFAALFVAGNIALPQLLHLVPNAGATWLPIYFFTLIGAYKYGWRVGLLTATLSPLANHLLFGMPPAAVLPLILIKSTVLAVVASYIAYRFKSVTLLLMIAVVAGYQTVGSLGEWALVGNLNTALQDFRMGLPGMAVQVIGGYLFIKYIIRR